MFFLFESSFLSIKHRIAFFTSAIYFKIIQYVCWGGSKEQEIEQD